MQKRSVPVKNNKKAKVLRIIDLLEKKYPRAGTALKYATPLELLVATILSAQCTDKQVNIVTQDLFKKYKKAEDYASAELTDLEKDVRPTGFFRNKAKNIKKSCQILVEKYNSQVPSKMEELLELPGVARKTANIVLSNAYGVIEGIAVDTHVRRLARRLGLTRQENPNKIEQDLMSLVPRKNWKSITDLLISHGRQICVSRKPRCGACLLKEFCPSAFSFNRNND